MIWARLRWVPFFAAPLIGSEQRFMLGFAPAAATSLVLMSYTFRLRKVRSRRQRGCRLRPVLRAGFLRRRLRC